MNRINDMEEINRALVYYVTGAIDIANYEIASLSKALREEKCTAKMMQTIENARRGYMKIRRDGYLISDLSLLEQSYSRYNIRDFLTDICMELNNYLGGLFDVEIAYNITEEDDMNIVIDATLVEKAIYDAVFGLLCEAGVKNRRITVYAKDLSKDLKISVRCDGAVKNKGVMFSEGRLLFSRYGENEQGSYAELAMKKLGGKYKGVYNQNEARLELYIPKNLKADLCSMKEEETYIRNNERVKVHKVCRRTTLERIFAPLMCELD